MADIMLCVSTNLFRIYLIRRFMHIFLNDKDERNCVDRLKTFMAYGGLFLVNTVAYLAFHMAWVHLVCNLVGIAFIALTYTKSMKMILFLTCFVCTINFGCNTLAVLPFVNYKGGFGIEQIYEVLAVFLVMICELLTEKIVAARRKTGNIKNIPLGLVPLCSLGMLCTIIYPNSSTKAELVTACIELILINFFTLYLYHMQSKILASQYENEMLQQKMEGYANQLNTMLQGEEMVRALRHDMKHHMNELKILAAKGENREIEEYIGSMEEFIANPNEIVSSGNFEIDSVMNYMLRRAKQELLTVGVNVRLPRAVDHSFDINVILGNLLENAIEAARQTEEKKLNVNIQLQQGFLRIQIENSYTGKLEKKNRKLLTTKNTKGLHGIGLENVRKIVEKYDGTMEICPDNDMFRVRLILYISELKE